MALAMTRPWKHPKTGIYWLRKRVPNDLVAVVGRREIQRTLNTRDPAEAKRLLAEAVTELEVQWANLRAGPRSLTDADLIEMASFVHDRWLQTYRDSPDYQKVWCVEVADRMWRPSVLTDVRDPAFLGTYDRNGQQVREQEALCKRGARDLLADRGLLADEQNYLRLAKAVGAAIQRASLALTRRDRGELEPVPSLGPQVTPQQNPRGAKPVPLDDLVTGWAAENKPAPKTLYEWRRVLKQLVIFVGHDDAARLTADDLVAWKAQMIAAGLRGKTIRDGKIAPVRAILRWAVDNRRLKANPAERITVDVKAAPGTKKRSFSDEEAIVLLGAARLESDPVRRWVPWICAYSGARLSEVCQLRREDIVSIDGIWCMRMVPEAGSLKTANAERTIPLHPVLIDEGFLAFAESVRSGPLFSRLRPDKFGRRGGTGTKQLGRWVRSLGIDDERVQPNHSWRHRMKTLGRRHGLAPDIVDALVGHARRSVADRYGEFEVGALFRELAKIPALSLSG